MDPLPGNIGAPALRLPILPSAQLWQPVCTRADAAKPVASADAQAADLVGIGKQCGQR
jgi:hypothetical protein